jgi:predicted phage terminase large subunit-like protein
MLQSRLENITADRLAFKNLGAYVALQNPNYLFAGHVMSIMKALMDVERGKIKRLVVNMPPRHGKTNLISEYFPAWYLGRNPMSQIIFSTYSFERAGDVGRKVRNQLTDPMHAQIFPGITVSKDNAGMNRVSTTQGGNFFAVGVGGAIIGRGAHLFVIDDPIKSREEAESELQREKLIDWFRSVAYTRLMPGNAIIVVQTRWHYDDLTGFLLNDLKHENWTVLSLPAIAESDDDPMGRSPGDALWPERYPIDTLAQIRETIGTREWTSQYQQSPIASSGGMIHLDWFKRYKHSEAMLRFEQCKNDRKVSMPYEITRIVCSWDTAFKESQMNDPSACTVWGTTKNNSEFYLLETVCGRLGFPALKKKVIEIYEKWFEISGRQVPIVIEDRGSGQSLIQELRRSTGAPIIAFPAENSKQIRLDSVAPLIEAGRVFLPDRSPWLVPYETELTRFPLWKNDDLVDSTSQFLQWAGKPRFVRSKLKFWK